MKFMMFRLRYPASFRARSDSWPPCAFPGAVRPGWGRSQGVFRNERRIVVIYLAHAGRNDPRAQHRVGDGTNHFVDASGLLEGGVKPLVPHVRGQDQRYSIMDPPEFIGGCASEDREGEEPWQRDRKSVV